MSRGKHNEKLRPSFNDVEKMYLHHIAVVNKRIFCHIAG